MTDESIFAAALAIPNPAERAAYLDRACGDNARMRREVEALLAAHAAANPLDRPPANIAFTGPYQPASDAPGSPSVGDRAGPYKLLERIGEGGMGEVWVAEQTEPIKRRVALKLIKPGMDTRGVLARFEAERQALAVMDHPNIAKVLDAGTTPDSRPYFVMELVKGTPITEFCDARKLTPRQRLELFVPVCQAIQHAHQKGIIHRDIKPSNVLVELYDDRAVAKVIDFGVAKAIGQSLTEKTLYTGLGAIVGTPAYMAPEQATFNALDVDTRSDVYSLGVLLYELLVGSPPHEPERLKKAALDEVLRLVREEEPQRPSQRLSTSQARASIAATRQSDPAKLSALMRGELDWIVMKALEKDRARRYETANNFAADVLRYLSGEPVQAVPPSASYRLRKFVRKNRGPVIAGAVLGVVLIVATAVSVTLAAWARSAERSAVAEKKAAEDARDAEAAAKRQAEVLAASAQVDLDLKYCQDGDKVLGLLRLCRTLDAIPDHAPELRECVVLNVLAWGQQFSPLVKLHHDGFDVNEATVTPEGTTVLTLGADGTARLFDTFTGRQLAVLRASKERAERVVLSGDGRTAVVGGDDRVVRLWDVPSGRLRAATTPHTGGIEKIVVCRDAGRVVTGVNIAPWWKDEGPVPEAKRPVVQLWDGKTGRLIGPLEHPSDWVRDFAIGNDGRAILTGDGTGSVRVWSGEDGRLLKHVPGIGTPVKWVLFNPTASTACTGDERTIRWWDTATWQLLGETPESYHWKRFVNDSVLECYYDVDVYSSRLQPRPPKAWVRDDDRPAVGDGTVLISGRGQRIDPDTGRTIPTPNRRFAPEARELAVDGRYLLLGTVILADLAADKPIGRDGTEFSFLYDVERRNWSVPKLSRPEGAWLAFGSEGRPSTITLLPISGKPIARAFLELFVECITRHELDPLGSPVKLRESAWDQKRHRLLTLAGTDPVMSRLAAFATDPWYWVRREFEEAPTYSEQSLDPLNRLIAAEPSKWRHYEARSTVHRYRKAWHLSLTDTLTAARLAGPAWQPSGFDSSSCDGLLKLGLPRDHYQLVIEYLTLYRANGRRSHELPTDIRLAIAHYRLGNYTDAIAVLRDADQETSARVAGCLMSPLVLPMVQAAGAKRILTPDGRVHAIRAMAYHRLGNAEMARESLNVARQASRVWSDSELDLLPEAERLIEGDKR